MATSTSREAATLRRRRRRSRQRSRLVALASLAALTAVVVLVVSAFSGGTGGVPASSATRAPAPSVAQRPEPQTVASIGNLRIQVPVPQAALTAVGYHGSQTGALELQPSGTQGNEGVLARLWRAVSRPDDAGPTWYRLDGPDGTQVLDVGAPAGTDVYAPVDGTVAAISDVVVDARVTGSRIDLRPTDAPALTLSVSQVEADPSLVVGAAVIAGSSKLGTVADLAAVERQALAAFAPDSGNNVSIEAHTTSSPLP